MERLLASAPDVVLSYPETEGDRALSPSPLVPAGSWLAEDATLVTIGLRASEPRLSSRRSQTKPHRRSSQSDSTGGASLFKDMAACPFRAFAKHRFGRAAAGRDRSRD